MSSPVYRLVREEEFEDRKRTDVSMAGPHQEDHSALWEALIFLNRRVKQLEQEFIEGDD